MDPREAVIFEQQTRLQKIARETMLGEKSPNMPGHQQTKRYPEKNDRRDIDRRESAVSRPRESFSNVFEHATGTYSLVLLECIKQKIGTAWPSVGDDWKATSTQL